MTNVSSIKTAFGSAAKWADTTATVGRHLPGDDGIVRPVLDHDVLGNSLREFCDPQYSNFRGFPATREIARQEWAASFFTYASTLQEVFLEPHTMPGTHPTMLFPAVQQSFFDDLDLVPGILAVVTARDFAGAWRVSIRSVTPSGGFTNGTTTYQFVAFSNVDSLHDSLETTLTALFESPSSSTLERITDIASAIHAATVGLQAQMLVTPNGGSTTTESIGVE